MNNEIKNTYMRIYYINCKLFIQSYFDIFLHTIRNKIIVVLFKHDKMTVKLLEVMKLINHPKNLISYSHHLNWIIDKTLPDFCIVYKRLDKFWNQVQSLIFSPLILQNNDENLVFSLVSWLSLGSTVLSPSWWKLWKYLQPDKLIFGWNCGWSTGLWYGNLFAFSFLLFSTKLYSICFDWSDYVLEIPFTVL